MNENVMNTEIHLSKSRFVLLNYSCICSTYVNDMEMQLWLMARGESL